MPRIDEQASQIEEDTKASFRPILEALEDRFLNGLISEQEYTKQHAALRDEVFEAIDRKLDALSMRRKYGLDSI